MKSIYLIVLLGLGIVSCEKRVIVPNHSIVEEVDVKGKFVECFYFFNTKDVAGFINFYKGEALDYTLKFKPGSFRDTTLFGSKEVMYYVRLRRVITTDELDDINGWCHVNLFLQSTVEYVMNVNHYNGGTTYATDDLHFLEPSTKTATYTDQMLNSFWINTHTTITSLDHGDS